MNQILPSVPASPLVLYTYTLPLSLSTLEALPPNSISPEGGDDGRNLGRDWEPCPCHKGHQAKRLHCRRLAPSVGASDDDCRGLAADEDIDRPGGAEGGQQLLKGQHDSIKEELL